MENIKTLLKLFRELGGKFENAELRYSKETGFYCWTLDRNLNTLISCPSHLLIDINDIDINKDGLFITRPEKYGNAIKFLKKYLAFHFNKTMLDQHIKKKQQIKTLSSRELSLISAVIPPYLYDINKDNALEYEKKRMLGCHKINYYDKTVLMPFVTFLNYNNTAGPYDISKKSISVSGKFNEEVFVEYQIGDALIMGSEYEFITDTKYAYSLPMWFETLNKTRIIIDRQPMKSVYKNGRRWPLLEKKTGLVKLSWLPLYIENAPRYPAIVAEMLASEVDMPAEKILHRIIIHNLHALVPAAFQLQESKNPFATYISSVAQRQLEIIAGTRQ